MVPRENKSNAYTKFGGTNEEHYGIFESGPLSYPPDKNFVRANEQ